MKPKGRMKKQNREIYRILNKRNSEDNVNENKRIPVGRTMGVRLVSGIMSAVNK